MPTLMRGQSSDCSTPVLDVFTRVSGVATDVAEISFQVWDRSSGIPVQVYPATGRQAIDPAPCPTGDRIDPGHYVARWTVPLAEPVGTHEIRWFFRLLPSSPEQTWTEEFEVAVVSASAAAEYTTVSALRDEGIALAQASDSQLLRKIQRASAMIERWTGRWFYPKSMTMLLDGTGGAILQVGPPIIAVSEVRLLGQDAVYISSSSELMDPSTYRVYNRHLSGLTDPDDRNDPKIEWLAFESWSNRLPGIVSSGRFPRGVMNVSVVGVFGYTDPDGTSTGKTPDEIARACELLVVRDLAKLSNGEDRDDARLRGKVTSLRTRDQSIQWGLPASDTRGTGTWSGDPEIDQIIAAFRRPPALGAV